MLYLKALLELHLCPRHWFSLQGHSKDLPLRHLEGLSKYTVTKDVD